MRIAPRTLLCATHVGPGGSVTDTGFDELRELCAATGDKQSLAIGMTGLVLRHLLTARRHEASRLASEHIGLLESIADPTLTVALSFTALGAKHETGELAEVLRLAQRVIDLADGDPTKGNLDLRIPVDSCAHVCAASPAGAWAFAGWRDDLGQAAAMARSAVDSTQPRSPR